MELTGTERRSTTRPRYRALPVMVALYRQPAAVPLHKPFLECISSSHMAMGLLADNPAAGPSTAAGRGEAARVGALWREHLKLAHNAQHGRATRPRALRRRRWDLCGSGQAHHTAPLDSLLGWAVSVGMMFHCPKAVASPGRFTARSF